MKRPEECPVDDDAVREFANRRADRWHVGKEIPIAVLVMLAVQTGGGIWWAASLSQKLDSVIATVAEMKLERYTKDDARRDQDLMKLRDADLERRISNLENRR
jgi:hypothetical protein